jgi:hypothetical protein
MFATRYFAIEGRLLDSFQFVNLHVDNKNTFSSGYASILRDACSAYSATCDRLVRMSGSVDKGLQETKANHFRDYLVKNVPTIADICVALEYSYGESFLMPFDSFRSGGSPDWWDAFTNQKHTEFDDFKQANLTNCLNAVGALAILVRLLDYSYNQGQWSQSESKFPFRLFGEMGTSYESLDEVRKALFGAEQPASNPAQVNPS